MSGSSNQTGATLTGLNHLKQSIQDILTTPIGSRVMRRDYGSRLFQLLDQPMNPSTIIQIIAATAEALARWEPRLTVQQVNITDAAHGHVDMKITGTFLVDGKTITVDGVIV